MKAPPSIDLIDPCENNLKKQNKTQVDTSTEEVKTPLEEMTQSRGRFIYALAPLVLVVAVCVAPRAALSNCKYNICTPVLG